MIRPAVAAAARLAVLCVMAVTLSPRPGLAQANVGAILGTVAVDGRVLAGAAVRIAGSSVDSTLIADARGEFRALNLPPGAYRIEVVATGCWPAAYETVVDVGQTVTVDAALTRATEKVTVTAAAPPLVDRRQVLSGTTLQQAELERLPTARDVWDVARQAPGVLVDRVNIAGSDSTEPSAISGPGYRMTQQAWAIDGVVITDSTTPGIAASFFDFDAFEHVQVSTGGTDVGVATGGAINLVTRRGTTQWRGSTRLLATTHQLQSGLNLAPRALAVAGPWNLTNAQRALDRANRIDLSRDMGVEAGGPLVHDRLWAWAAFGRQDIDLFTIGNYREATTFNTVSAKVDGLSRGTQWQGLFIRDRRLKSGRNVGPLRPPETAWDFPVTTSISKFDAARSIRNRHYLTTAVSYVQEDLAAEPAGGHDENAVIDQQGIWRGSFLYGTERRPQVGLKIEDRTFLGVGGVSSELRVGAERRFSWSEAVSTWPGQGGVIGVGTAVHTIGMPLGIATVGSRSADERTITSAYAQDTIRAGVVTATVGLRVDHQSGANRATTLPPNPLFSGLLPGLQFAGLKRTVSWTSISPRLGVTYALDPSGTTLLKASVRQFPDELSLTDIQHPNPTRYQPGGIIGVAQSVTFLWLDDGDGRFNVGEIGPVVATANVDPTRPDFFPNQVDPRFRSPRTDEMIVGVDRELGHGLVASMDVTWRRSHHPQQTERLVFDDAAGPRTGTGRVHTPADYVLATTLTGQLPDGSSYNVPVYRLRPGLTYLGGSLLTNGQRTQRYLGWTGSLRKRLSDGWMLRGWFSVNRWTWRVPPAEAADPTPREAGEFANGGAVVQDTSSLAGLKTSVFLNAPWSFDVSSLYRVAPARRWGFDVAADLYGRAGYPIPYVRAVSGVETGDGIDRRVLVSPTVDYARNDPVANLNARVEKSVGMRSGSLSLSLDVFNVLNRTSVLQRQHELNLPVGDYVIETVSPRALRLGARIRWN